MIKPCKGCQARKDWMNKWRRIARERAKRFVSKGVGVALPQAREVRANRDE